MTFTKNHGSGSRRVSRSQRSGGGDYAARALSAIWRRVPLVLCVALALSAFVVTLDALRGAVYTAEALVRVEDFDTDGDGVSRERLGEVVGAAGPERVSRSAMDSMGWENGSEEFTRGLEVDAGSGGELRVAFSADTPEVAAEGANAYADAFTSRVDELGGERLAGGTLGAGAEVMQEASPASAPGWTRPLVVGSVVFVPGLLVGGVLALALEGRDRRWRSARDAELTLGAPVLGVIPEHGAARSSGEDGVVWRT